MDDQTIDYILTDKEIDPISNVPLATVVYMLYYGLELKHFLTDISDEMIDKFDLSQHRVGEYSIYRSGSVAQGFYLNTNYLPDARDIDVVAISHRYDIRERCKYNEEANTGKGMNNVANLRATIEHEEVGKNREESCISIGKCEDYDDPYFNVKVFPDTPPGYVLIERCRRHGKAGETHKERFVSSLQATEARVKFWSDLQPLIKQKFDNIVETSGDQESSLFSFVEPHGPAATTFMSLFEATTPFETDFVYCVPYPKPWPNIAAEFLTRERRSGWPSDELLDQILRDGCTLIPKGELGSKMEVYEWRISFTGELRLARSLNITQRELIHALKTLISERQHPYDLLDVSTSVESYHLLTLLYHEIEIADPSFWVPHKIAKMMFLLLDKYTEHFERRYLPHFMILSRNIFAKYQDLSEEEADTVLYTILRLRRDPVGQILQQEKYINLPVHLHKWAFEPIVDGISLNSNQQLHPVTYVQSLLRLSKAHLMVKHHDKALIYATDAQRFFLRIAERDTTVHDIIDLHLTLTVSLHRNGEIEEAMQVINNARKIIVREGDNLDATTLDVFYRISSRLKLTEYIRNSKQNELDFSFIPEYMNSLAILQYPEDLAIEGMYFTMVFGGASKVNEIAVSLERYLPSMFVDIVNAKDMKIIYDRREQVCLKGGSHFVKSNEEMEIGSTMRMDIDGDENPTTEDLLWTAFGVKTDIENDLPPKVSTVGIKQYQDIKTTAVTGDKKEIREKYEVTKNTQTLLDMSGLPRSFLETNFDEKWNDQELLKDTMTSYMNGATYTSFEPEIEESAIVERASDATNELNADIEMQQNPKEEVIYDRKRCTRTTKDDRLSLDKPPYSESVMPEHSENDIEFTDADVNMVDSWLVDELCRIKLFNKLNMDGKSNEILHRLKSKIKSARDSGRKVNLKMVERALEMFIEAARSMSETKEELNDIMDINHIYFHKAEKPYLDEIIQGLFKEVDTEFLALPIQLVLLHTKMLYFTRRNMLDEVDDIFRKTETYSEMLGDITDRKVSECILELHRKAISEHFCIEVHLSEDFEYETGAIPKELSVKTQVFKWIETVFETMIKYEPKNKYLDEVFTNG